MGRDFVSITYKTPFSREVALAAFGLVLKVVQENWLEATDEWSRGYRDPLDVINGLDGVNRVLETLDFSVPDHDGIAISVVHSPLTAYSVRCTVWPNRGPEGFADYQWAEVMLKIRGHSFREERGLRETSRLEGEWQACREPAWGDNTPWERMPPRTPEFARWWRNYEEACAATEDVGEKNFAYFMRIVEELKKLYPVIAYEEDDTFTNYESVPAQDARWAREDAEQEARFQQEEAEKKARGSD